MSQRRIPDKAILLRDMMRKMATAIGNDSTWPIGSPTQAECDAHADNLSALILREQAAKSVVIQT